MEPACAKRHCCCCCKWKMRKYEIEWEMRVRMANERAPTNGL